MSNTENRLSVHKKRTPLSDSSNKNSNNNLSTNNSNVGCGVVLIVLFFLFLMPAILDDTTTNTPIQSKEWFIYTVKAGDNLSTIANTYNVNISDIRNNEAVGWRAGYVGDTIYPGQEIQLFTQRCDACESLSDNLIRKKIEKDQREKEEEMERLRKKREEKDREARLSDKAKERTKQWEKNRIEIEKQKKYSKQQSIIDTNKKPKETVKRSRNVEEKIDKWEEGGVKKVDDCNPKPYRFISHEKAADIKDIRGNYQPEIVQIFDSFGLKTSWNVYLKSSGLSETKFKRHKKKIKRVLSCFVDKRGNVKSVKLISNLTPDGLENIPIIEFNDVAKSLVDQLLFNPGIKDGKPVCMWVSVEVIISKRR